MSKNLEFKVGERVVYPSHGVGEIVDVEAQMIADISLKVYVISFPQDKMILRVPVNRASAVGLRTLINKNDIHEVYAFVVVSSVSKVFQSSITKRVIISFGYSSSSYIDCKLVTETLTVHEFRVYHITFSRMNKCLCLIRMKAKRISLYLVDVEPITTYRIILLLT